MLTPRQQGLECFYSDPYSLHSIAQRIVNSNAIGNLAASWRLPLELAADLAKIALFDVVVLCDDSASMKVQQKGERIEDLKTWVRVLEGKS